MTVQTSTRVQQLASMVQTISILLNEELEATGGLWDGVAERALYLGYPSHKVSPNASKLGKFVANSDLERRTEDKYCYGTLRPMYVYKVCPELDARIKAFFKELNKA